MKKQAILEAVTVTSGEKSELTISTGTRAVVLRDNPPPPSANQIQQALDFLLSLKTEDIPATEGPEGDVFLIYDLSLRTRGERSYRLRNQIPMYGILTDDGISDAAAVMDAALAQMTRPLKMKALSWLNDRNNGIRTVDTFSRKIGNFD